jgi:hypothetical protein
MPRVSNATLEGWIEEAADEVSREAARVEWEKRGTFTRCGARTRRGTPCQRWGVRGTGRCPNHGGLSSGPTTAAGKARIAAALASPLARMAQGASQAERKKIEGRR